MGRSAQFDEGWLVLTSSHELHVDVSSVQWQWQWQWQWMLTINLLAGAIATPTMGRLRVGPHEKRLLRRSLREEPPRGDHPAAAPISTLSVRHGRCSD